MRKLFETSIKIDGRYHFIGWGEMRNEAYCIETKRRGMYLYKKYESPSGKIEEIKYGSFVEE